MKLQFGIALAACLRTCAGRLTVDGALNATLTVTSPSADDYLYDSNVYITWELDLGKIDDGVNCSLVDVFLYQGIDDDAKLKSKLNIQQPESDSITWLPANTVNPATNEPYDDGIVGTDYSIFVECDDDADVSGFSGVFDLVYAPTHTPTPKPSTPQPSAPTESPRPGLF